jgi:hypothetical protein
MLVVILRLRDVADAIQRDGFAELIADGAVERQRLLVEGERIVVVVPRAGHVAEARERVRLAQAVADLAVDRERVLVERDRLPEMTLSPSGVAEAFSVLASPSRSPISP